MAGDTPVVPSPAPGMEAGPSGFQRWLLPGLARKHDAIAAALAAEAAEKLKIQEKHEETDKAYHELHRHAKEKHKENTREKFSLEQQLEYAITTELKLRAEVERLERALQLTQHDLGNARYELASLGEEWRLDEGRARSLVRTHELGHLQLCDHIESAVDALSRWRGDGERLCDALDDALAAVGVQREVDEAARVARETKAVGGSTRGLGNASAAEQRELAAELGQQREFVAEIRKALDVWGEREIAWADSLPTLRAEFASALFAAQLRQQQELSALILKSPEKRKELQARLKEIHDHREAVCGVWPNLNVGRASQNRDEKSAASKQTPKVGRRGAAASAVQASPAKSSPGRNLPPMRQSPSTKVGAVGSVKNPVKTPSARGRRAVSHAVTAATTSTGAIAPSPVSKSAPAIGSDAEEGTASIATTKRVQRFKKAPRATITSFAESKAVVVAAGTIEKSPKRPSTPSGDGVQRKAGGPISSKRPGSAASLAGSVPVWSRPGSASSIGIASRPSTPGPHSRPGTAGSGSLRRPPTPEQVASQSTIRAALTVQMDDPVPSSTGVDVLQVLNNGDSADALGSKSRNDGIEQIGRAMVESRNRSANVWRDAGRPSDDSEMVRQVLALQGIADAAENVLPPVLLLARTDTAGVHHDASGGVLSLADTMTEDEAEEDLESDHQALRLNRFEWGTEEWSQAILPVPNYTVHTKDGFSAHVNGFDPSTACAATLLRPRALGNTVADDVGALVVCGEVPFDREKDDNGSHVEHQVLQLYEPRLQEWRGLPAPAADRRFPVLLGLADGALLLVCGYDKGGSLVKTAEILHQRNPVEGEEHRRQFDAWKSAGRLTAGRDGFAIGQLDDGRVIVAGGTHYPFGVVESGLRTAEMWVPTTNSWQKMPSMNDGHGYCAGCRMADNRFMVSGGYDPQGAPSRRVEAYNPRTFEWDNLADLPHATRDHKMCAVPGVQLLIDQQGWHHRTAQTFCIAFTARDNACSVHSGVWMSGFPVCVAGGVLLTTVGGAAMLYDADSDHWHIVSQDDSTRFQPLLLHCETGDPDLMHDDDDPSKHEMRSL